MSPRTPPTAHPPRRPAGGRAKTARLKVATFPHTSLSNTRNAKLSKPFAQSTRLAASAARRNPTRPTGCAAHPHPGAQGHHALTPQHARGFRAPSSGAASSRPGNHRQGASENLARHWGCSPSATTGSREPHAGARRGLRQLPVPAVWASRPDPERIGRPRAERACGRC